MNPVHLVIPVMLALFPAAQAAQETPSVSVEVTTAMPQQHDFAEMVNGYGSVETDPRATFAVSLPLAGQVTQLMVVTGQTVASGQPLLVFTADPAGRLVFEQAQADLKLTRAALAQTQALYAQHLATQGQLDATRKALADAEANVATQQALGSGRSRIEIKAPIAGVVETIAVATGQRVAAATSLLQLAPAQQRLVRVGVEPGDAARLKVGQAAALVPAFGGATFAGKLLQTGQAVNAQTRLVDVLVSMPADAPLPLGSVVQAQIESAHIQAWAVPRGAVLSDAQGAYLFQIDHDVAHRVDVKLVQPKGDSVGVLGPLKAALPVVVLGSHELADGMAVRVKTP
ncbi:MAG: efflux RND transporter periplasmic adaptor subunit [Nevskiaceae bacterium]|nr:MAG: efflux RND transporter periplasmic adaptor subunit [Nevskiaceae bacterium]TBR71849.1 MAG: efflux RND transporter periplasmic adaptor subunit [Nevskiaceae bacterium]